MDRGSEGREKTSLPRIESLWTSQVITDVTIKILITINMRLLPQVHLFSLPQFQSLCLTVILQNCRKRNSAF